MAHNVATHWTVGAVAITRVADPDFDLVIPQDAATAKLLAASTWLAPHFVTPTQALRVGSSAITVRTPSATIAVDPFLAFDDPARLAPRLAAMRAAGTDPDEVDVVVLSHIDGVGACIAADGSPAFGRARYLAPAAELADARAGRHGDGGLALAELADKGVVEPLDDIDSLVPGIRFEDAPGHNPGHVLVWIDSGGSQAVVAGHLFLHPAQIANPDVDNGDLDPTVLAATRRAVLARCHADDVLLVAPLFAAPGGGKVVADGGTWRLAVD